MAKKKSKKLKKVTTPKEPAPIVEPITTIISSEDKAGVYNVTVTSVDGTEVNCDTDNVFEAISSFKPDTITGKVLVTVFKGDKKFEKLLFAPQARRLFANEFALNIFVRNLQRALA